jgi:AcrR family transcriptional regulator
MPTKSARSPRKTTAAQAAPAKAPKLRRVGAENSETRTLLLDAAEALMREEGYAAVTSRRVGEKAGIAPQLVHYYFRNMDELFLAMWRRYADKNLIRQAEAFASGHPLRSIWHFSTDVVDTSLGLEFMALARHRKAIRAELAQTGERLRATQTAGLAQLLEVYDLAPAFKSPEVMSLVISGVARMLVMEELLGIKGGHAKLSEFVEQALDQLEAGAETRRPARARRARS